MTTQTNNPDTAACCDTNCCGAETSTPALSITEAVRDRYGAIAVEVLEKDAGCCGTSCCGGNSASDAITSNLYATDEIDGLPLKAALASLGCGNPTALAELHAGETVLDLGSGGGIDVLLSARRVGPTGFAYGVDMTDSMLELARRNAAEAGVSNVAFLKGDIAAIPLPDNSVDVIISNCVINLAAEKAPVLREAFRVLKPGGRFAVSDIVIHGGLPEGVADTTAMRRDFSSWAGCIAGALTDAEYRSGLEEAGFTTIELEITRRYRFEDVPEQLVGWAQGLDRATAQAVVERFASTFVRAMKPG
jgi:ubiquinone/menaquinone biosynthesis C-methylase UbiE